MSKKTGVIFREMILPDRIKLEMEKLNDNEWRFHYTETLTNASEEAIQNTIKILNTFGFSVRRRGKTLSMKGVGSREKIVSGLITELISMSNLGDVSLREVILFAIVGYSYFQSRIEASRKIELRKGVVYPGAAGEDRGEKHEETKS